MTKFDFKKQNETTKNYNTGDKLMNKYHQISLFELPEFYNNNRDFCSNVETNKCLAEEPDYPGKHALKNQSGTNDSFNTGDTSVNEYHQISLFELPEFYDDNCDLEPKGNEKRLIYYWGCLNLNWRFLEGTENSKVLQSRSLT